MTKDPKNTEVGAACARGSHVFDGIEQMTDADRVRLIADSSEDEFRHYLAGVVQRLVQLQENAPRNQEACAGHRPVDENDFEKINSFSWVFAPIVFYNGHEDDIIELLRGLTAYHECHGSWYFDVGIHGWGLGMEVPKPIRGSDADGRDNLFARNFLWNDRRDIALPALAMAIVSNFGDYGTSPRYGWIDSDDPRPYLGLVSLLDPCWWCGYDDLSEWWE